jgi:predicted transcriptional regulator
MVKGASARENCPTDIKLMLLEGPKNFEALVEGLKGKYSRGTINKYLGELFKDGLVTRQGRRGPYELTPEGRRKAEHDAIMNRITKSLKKEPLEKLKELEIILESWIQSSFAVELIKTVEKELHDTQILLQVPLAIKQEIENKHEQIISSEKPEFYVDKVKYSFDSKEEFKQFYEDVKEALAFWQEKEQKLISQKEKLENDIKEIETVIKELKTLKPLLSLPSQPTLY